MQEDPRVIRTRAALREALARLLRERPFEDLTLNEIAEAAGVNRATIYKHHPDKFALLDAWVAADLQDRIYAAIGCANSCADKVAALISSACECVHHVNTIARPDDRLLRPIAEARIRALVLDSVHFAIEQKVVRAVGKPDLAAAMASGVVSGAASMWTGGTDKALAAHVAKVMAALAPMIVPCEVMPRMTRSISFG